MKVLGIIVAALIAYFLGTIPVGEWVARLYGKDDLTKTGSGNPGTTNVLRTMGWLPSLRTLAGDCLKGVLGAWPGSAPCWGTIFPCSAASTAARASPRRWA